MIADIYYSPELQELIAKNNLGVQSGTTKHAWAININLFGALCWGKLASKSTTRISETIDILISDEKKCQYKFKQDSLGRFNKFVGSINIKYKIDDIIYGHIIEIMNVVRADRSIGHPGILEMMKLYDLLCNAGNTFVYVNNKDTIREIYNKGIEYIMSEHIKEYEKMIMTKDSEIVELNNCMALQRVEHANDLLKNSLSNKEMFDTQLQKMSAMNSEMTNLRNLINIMMEQRNDALKHLMICYKIPVTEWSQLLSMDFRGGRIENSAAEFCKDSLLDYIYYITDGYDHDYDKYYLDTWKHRNVHKYVPVSGKSFTGTLGKSSGKNMMWNILRIGKGSTLISFDDPTRLFTGPKKILMGIIKVETTL